MRAVQEYNIVFLETSAKSGKNVKFVFHDVAKCVHTHRFISTFSCGNMSNYVNLK